MAIFAIETDSAVPPGSFRYGVFVMEFEDGQPLTDASVRIYPSDIETVDGIVVLPPALSQAQASLTQSFRPPGDGILFLGQSDVGASFSVALPYDPLLGPGEFVPWLAVRAGGPMGVSWLEREVVVPSSGVVFDLPAPVDLVAPTAGAVIDASTVFRWTGGPSGGQTALLLSCDWTDSTGAARNVSYRTLEVTGSEATLPALPDLTIDPGATCQWKVAWYPAGQRSCEERVAAAFARAGNAVCSSLNLKSGLTCAVHGWNPYVGRPWIQRGRWMHWTRIRGGASLSSLST